MTVDRRRLNGPGNWPPADLRTRFFRHVDTTGECWVWTGSTVKGGYGVFSIDRRRMPAHRFSYLEFVGVIPEGFEVDHLCRNRACVRPAHLEAVTLTENRRRQVRPKPRELKPGEVKKCGRGHVIDAVIWRSRRGSCPTCSRTRQREKYRRRDTPQTHAAQSSAL